MIPGVVNESRFNAAAVGWGNMEWLRLLIVDEYAPQIISEIMNSLPYLEWYRGTDIQVGLSSNTGTGGTAGWTADNWNASMATWMTSILRMNIGTGYANASGFLSPQHEANFLGLLAHELMHAVMFATNHNIMFAESSAQRAPQWFVEGMAEAVGGHKNYNALAGLNQTTVHAANADTLIRNVLSQLGTSSHTGVYGASYLATMYLGWLASGKGEINSANISAGLSLILGDNANGNSLDSAINKYTDFATTAAFFEHVTDNADNQEAVNFVKALIIACGPNGAGSILAELDEQFLVNSGTPITETNFFRIGGTATGSFVDMRNTVPNGYRIVYNGGGLSASGQAVHNTFMANYNLSNGTAIRNANDTATVSFTSTRVDSVNEGQFYYIVKAKGDAAPTARDFNTAVAGTPFNSSTHTFNIDGITSDDFDVYIVVKDNWGNVSQILGVGIYDISASATRTAANTATVTLNSNIEGNYYYMVVDASDPSPTSAEIISASGGVPRGTANVGNNVFNLSGVLNGQRVYIVVEDDSGALSNVASVAIPNFTPPTAPTIHSLTGTRTGASTGSFTFQSDQMGTVMYVITDATDPFFPDADYIRANDMSGGTVFAGSNTVHISGINPETQRVHIIVVNAHGMSSGVIRNVIPEFNPDDFPIIPASPTLTLNLQIGSNAGDTMRINIESMSAANLDIVGLNTLTRESSLEALSALDAALNKVSSQRARLGAYQNRLEFTMRNLNVSHENLSASESRIRNADMAREMMALTKHQVLQQSGVAMLSQANQGTDAVLRLIR
jgi:flagellin-like hook-associated protein FlgL